MKCGFILERGYWKGYPCGAEGVITDVDGVQRCANHTIQAVAASRRRKSEKALAKKHKRTQKGGT